MDLLVNMYHPCSLYRHTVIEILTVTVLATTSLVHLSSLRNNGTSCANHLNYIDFQTWTTQLDFQTWTTQWMTLDFQAYTYLPSEA